MPGYLSAPTLELYLLFLQIYLPKKDGFQLRYIIMMECQKAKEPESLTVKGTFYNG